MIHSGPALVLDVDGTLARHRRPGESYADVAPAPAVVERLRDYRSRGHYVILHSARNMRSLDGNLGLITARTGAVLLDWLERHDIPHDELHLGKPWPGNGGFVVDDRAVRPDEFVALDFAGITELLDASARRVQ